MMKGHDQTSNGILIAKVGVNKTIEINAKTIHVLNGKTSLLNMLVRLQE
jgi:hypothetical protein